MVDVGLQQPLGEVEVLVVLYDELAVLDEDVGHHLQVRLEQHQKAVVDVLGRIQLLLPELELYPALVDLVAGLALHDLLVHVPRVVGAVPSSRSHQ